MTTNTKTILAALIGLGAIAVPGVAEANEKEISIDASLAESIDVAHGLQADEAARRAVATSPDVRARDESYLAAEEARSQAGREFVPRLSGSARYMRLSPIDQPEAGTIVVAPNAPPGVLPAGTPLANAPLSFPVLLNQTTLQAQLSVPVSDYLLRLSERHEAAKEGSAAARLQAEAMRLIVATNARVAYYDWIRSRLQVTVAEKSLATARGHVTDATSALAAGVGSQADVLRAESMVASSELLVARAESATAKAEDRLRTLMHLRSRDLGKVGEDVRADPPPFDAAGGVEALVAEAIERRREIRALGHTAASLRQQAAVARAGFLPRLDGVAETTVANPNPRIFPVQNEFRSTWSVGAVLSWSTSDLLAAGPATRAAEAKEREALAQRRALSDQVRAEVVDGYRALEESRVALASARRGVAAAEEGHRVRLALYRVGRATGTEMSDAESELTSSRFGLVNAYIDARLARVRLTHAVGRD
jgi:outer membrane protein TolC